MIKSLYVRTLSAALVPVFVTPHAIAAGGVLPATNAPASPPAMEAPQATADVKGSIKMANVSFVYPKDGDTVATSFTAKFKVDGMKIANAGVMTAGTGHHHLIIDGSAVATGQPIPANATHLHFGTGQSEAKIQLKPGSHTLTLQFADGAHLSYGEMMSQTIKVTVK